MRQTRRAKRHGREAKDHAVPHAGGPPGTAWGQRDGGKLSVTRSGRGPSLGSGKDGCEEAARRQHQEGPRVSTTPRSPLCI